MTSERSIRCLSGSLPVRQRQPACCRPAVGGLLEQIRQEKLCIPPGAGIHQVILDESRQAEAFIEFANEQQTTIRGHP